MTSPHVTYAPRPDSTTEAELNALAAVYKFVLSCHEKRTAPESRPDDAMKGSKNVHHAETEYTG